MFADFFYRVLPRPGNFIQLPRTFLSRISTCYRYTKVNDSGIERRIMTIARTFILFPIPNLSFAYGNPNDVWKQASHHS